VSAHDETPETGSPAQRPFLDGLEQESCARWFEALDARFRGGATKWALFNGLRGPDAENLAVEAMTDLAKHFASKGVQLDEDVAWNEVRAQLVTTVRHKAASEWRKRGVKPGNYGGKSGQEDADPLKAIADVLGAETWSPTNIDEVLDTTLGDATLDVKQEVGVHAWGAYVDMKFRGLSAKEAAEKRGFSSADDVYRVCERVNRLFRKRLVDEAAARGGE
jgi:hypothetical protein